MLMLLVVGWANMEEEMLQPRPSAPSGAATPCRGQGGRQGRQEVAAGGACRQ